MRFLITGANRGLGLELAKQATSHGHEVIGTARDPREADELSRIASKVMALDIMSPQSVQDFQNALEAEHMAIDVLVNNAAIAPRHATIDELSTDVFEEELVVQVVGPYRVTKAVLPSLRRGGAKRIVNVSSNLGSHQDCAGSGDNKGGGFYSYRAGKTALNMITQCMSRDLDEEGFTVVCVHPGWVRTRMGGPEAPLDVKQSQSGVFKVIDGLTREDNGSFISWEGERMAW